MNVRVLYFAILREQAGRDAEDRDTHSDTPQALYEELRDTHGFSLPPHAVRAAVNDQIVPPNHRLHDGDTIVFLPPVAGG